MRQFPTLSATEFEWFSIGWEPIAMSGERIAAFIAIREKNSASPPQIHRCIAMKQAQCMLGENYSQATDFLDFAEQLIATQLKDSPKFAASVEISGFSICRTGSVFSSSLADAVRIAIREASLLGSATLANFVDQLIVPPDTAWLEKNSSSEDRFFQMVQRNVIAEAPHLGNRFRQSYKLAANARGTRLDFAGRRLFANLHRLKPGRTLGQQVNIGKQKLLDLSSVRLWLKEQNDFASNELVFDFELLTHRPESEGIDYTEADIRLTHEAVEELTYAADHHELRIRQYGEIDGAVQRILEAER
jgi:hypothetical protein